jgi:CBS domain containing-hemolysin-like protein
MIAVWVSGLETHEDDDIFRAYYLLLALCLLAANAFYVAAEFALVKSRGFRINAMAEEGRFGARLLQKMVENIEVYLASCQLGITMASLGLGWVGEPTVSALGASLASAWNARLRAALHLLRDGLPGFFLVAYRGW